MFAVKKLKMAMMITETKMENRVESRPKKLVFYVVLFGLLSGSLCCYGKESATKDLDIKEFPAYFSVAAWKVVQLANAHSHVGHEKIVVILDGPVEYIAGLSEKNEDAAQAKVNTDIPFSRLSPPHPYHGTIVAGLIAGDPRKLPCHNDSGITFKPCDKSEMVVTGMARQIKLINAPDAPAEKVADTLKELLSITKSLTDDEIKETKRFSRAIAPTKRIFNFSVGFDHLENEKYEKLQEIRKQCEMNMPASISNKAEYILPKYCIEYIDNNLSLSLSSNSVLESRPKLKKNWEENLKKPADGVVAYYDGLLEKVTNAVKDTLLSGKDDIIAIVAAGNKGL